MSSEIESPDGNETNRRQFLKAGAAGAAGIAALSAGMNTASAENKPPDRENLRTNSKTGVRTAIITDAQLNIGPFLAEKFAKLGYNLVLADVREGLPDKLRKLGAAKVVEVPGIEQEAPNHEGRPGVIQKVVDVALDAGYASQSAFTAMFRRHFGVPPNAFYR